MTEAKATSRVFVVGGAGFAGRHVVRELAARGYGVTITSRTGVVAQDVIRTLGPGHEVLTWTGDLDGLVAAMSESNPEVVVLLAAHFVAEHEPADVVPLVEANVTLAAVVLEAARLAGVRRIVTAGTFWEERSPNDLNAVDLYAATRRAANELLRYYVAAYEWTAAHVRVTDLYGPSDPRRKLFYHLRRAVETGVALPMSAGDQYLDLVHVSDAAAAFGRTIDEVARNDRPGLVEYGTFSGTQLRLREIVTIYERVVGRAVPVVWGGRQYRFREVMEPRVIPGPPGWVAQVSLSDGLRDMERAPGGLLAP